MIYAIYCCAEIAEYILDTEIECREFLLYKVRSLACVRKISGGNVSLIYHSLRMMRD